MQLPRHHWIHRVLHVLVLLLALATVGGFGVDRDGSGLAFPDVVLDATDPTAEFHSSVDSPDLEEVMVTHIPGGAPRDAAHAHDVSAPPAHVDAPRAPPDRPPSLA